MKTESIAIVLVIIAIALLIWSFFKQDTGEKLQEEFEELSLQLLQDIHQLKERVSALEKELAISSSNLTRTDQVQEGVKENVIHLYKNGVSIQEAASQENVSEEMVKQIIDDYIVKSSD